MACEAGFYSQGGPLLDQAIERLRVQGLIRTKEHLLQDGSSDKSLMITPPGDCAFQLSQFDGKAFQSAVELRKDWLDFRGRTRHEAVGPIIDGQISVTILTWMRTAARVLYQVRGAIRIRRPQARRTRSPFSEKARLEIGLGKSYMLWTRNKGAYYDSAPGLLPRERALFVTSACLCSSDLMNAPTDLLERRQAQQQ